MALAVSTDWRQARLTPAEHAMLEFSEGLTLVPSGMRQHDVESLRRHGFDDRQILSVTLAAAYRNYIVRVADALGVELRKGGAYAPEILRAFGVAEADVQTTIYADRLTATKEGEPTRQASARSSGAPSGVARDACWIDPTPEDPARHAEVHEDLLRLTAPRALQNLGLAFGKRPEALAATLAFGWRVGMGGSGLPRRLESIIGLVVAATHAVRYMGIHHAQALLDEGASAAALRQLVEGPGEGQLAGPEREVATFSAKVTRVPSAMTRADVEGLRAVGFADHEIVTIAAGAAFESFLCCLAAGLGIRLEDASFAPAVLETFAATAPAPSA